MIEGVSDHKAVLLSASIAKSKVINKIVTIPDFNSADDFGVTDELAFHLDDFTNSASDNACDLNMLWSRFKQSFFYCISRFVPHKKKTVYKQNPWINRHIIRLKRKIRRIRRKNKKNPSNADNSRLEQLSETLKNDIQQAKYKYCNTSLSQFVKSAPQKFWRFLSPRTSPTSTFLISGREVDNDSIIANEFNAYFKSVFTSDDGNIVSSNGHTSLPRIDDIEVTESGIFSLLLNLDVRKSAGPDLIPNAFLKRYAEWITGYLQVIFTKSLATASVPDDWKTARVIPIHKSGNKQSLTNYRPISLTCTACKLLEHIISKHISSFLQDHSVLTDKQYGFRRGFSTTSQLVEFSHDLSLAINKQSQVDVIFLDFCKAFDKVSHPKLLTKLNFILKNETLIAWIRDYLTNRRQFVEFNECSSNVVGVDSGVPQGSVLGPLLFLLFINDIGNNISVKIRLFADDCVLYNEINCAEDQRRLNHDLDLIVTWCRNWQMCLNYDKTVFMSVTRKRRPLPFSYCANNCSIMQVNEYKYLGVSLTSDLRWNKHINAVSSRALNKLYFLRRNLKFATPDTKPLTYNTLIYPIIEYASAVWGPFTSTNLARLERIQNKSVRFIFNQYDRQTSTGLLTKKAGLITLEMKLKISRLKVLHQIIHNQSCINKDIYLSFSSSRPTRRSHSLQLTPFQPKNDCYKYSFFPRAVAEWNDLPFEIANLNNVDHFVCALRDHFVGDY